jgi:glycosyltransferase involved in cell wall biosynthesis
MRIAIVYDAVYPYVKGGGERRYYELARRLAARGHDVHWYGMHYWDGPAEERRDGVTYHGVCRPLPLYTEGGRRSILQALVFGLACLKLVRRRHDAVDCCGFPFFSLFSARLAVALRGGMLVSTWHEVWGAAYWKTYLGRLGFVGAAVERLAARIPQLVVAVSDATAQRLAAELGRGRGVRVLPNGVDAAYLEALSPASTAYDITYAGRLCDFKDLELLIEALPLVRAQRPGATCLIVGDGPHRQTLEKLTATVGVADAVTFAGFIEDQAEFYAMVKACRVFALPSRREGFGIVVLEANAAGLPVVVANHPDNHARDLIGSGIDGGNGEVVAARATTFADALLRLLDEPSGARVQACHEVARRHDWDAIGVRYERVLEQSRGEALV